MWAGLLLGTEDYISRVSNIESDNSQNVGLEDYNIISDGIFPHFTTPSIKIGFQVDHEKLHPVGQVITDSDWYWRREMGLKKF